MTTIIDGFNLMYRLPGIDELMYRGKLYSAAKMLISRLNEYSDSVINKKMAVKYRKKCKFIVVIDGKKKPGINILREIVKNVEIHYSQDFSADHLIKKIIKKFSNPKSLTLITSDKEILLFAKVYYVTQIKSEDYAQFLTKALENADLEEKIPPGEEADLKLSRDEVSYWEKIFNA